MGCGGSSNKSAYPRQSYPVQAQNAHMNGGGGYPVSYNGGYPNQHMPPPPPGHMMAQNCSRNNDDRLLTGMVIGGAVGYMAGAHMGGGGYGGMGMIGVPDVMGVDIL